MISIVSTRCVQRQKYESPAASKRQPVLCDGCARTAGVIYGFEGRIMGRATPAANGGAREERLLNSLHSRIGVVGAGVRAGTASKKDDQRRHQSLVGSDRSR